MSKPSKPAEGAAAEEALHIKLAVYLSGSGQARYSRFVLAVLSSIPWIGSVMAAAALKAEKKQNQVNLLMFRWVEQHEASYKRLEATVAGMIGRIEAMGPSAQERLQEEQYLGLVRRGFRVWDEASTQEKRQYVQRTLTNAAGPRICSDDVLRMFLQWIEQYDELHFRVMRIVYKSPGATRAHMWKALHGEVARESSADADLFKLIIRDLSTGSVIRQHRETNSEGQFLAKTPRPKRRTQVLSSAFDDDKPYELTELGSQFVHYVLSDVTPRLE